MTEPVVIGIGATKFVKNASTKMMTLIFPSSGGTLSLHDDTGVDYQVPVGKKFIILAQFASAGMFAHYTPTYSARHTTADLWKNTTTDTTAGGTRVVTNGSATSYWSSSGASQSSKPMNPKIECYIEIPAGSFIVGDIQNQGYGGMTVTGVECDV